MEYKKYSLELAKKLNLHISTYGKSIKLSKEDSHFFAVSPLARFIDWRECYHYLAGFFCATCEAKVDQ